MYLIVNLLMTTDNYDEKLSNVIKFITESMFIVDFCINFFINSNINSSSRERDVKRFPRERFVFHRNRS